MPEPVAAEQPPLDGTRDDAVRLRQPPGDLGRAYRIAFVETGSLEVVLPATEQVPAQVSAQVSAQPGAPTHARRPVAAPARARAVPVQRSAPTEVLSTTPPRTAPAAPAVPPPGSGPSSHLQLARRSRALLLGLALGVLLGVAAVAVTGLLVAALGLLPR